MKNKPLLSIFLTVFIDMLGLSIVIPILSALLVLPNGSTILPGVDLNTRLIVFGYLIGSYALAQFISTPIIGQLSDRYGRKPLLFYSILGTFVARILFIWGILNANIYLLFISRILDGITGGNISVAQSAIADISTNENKAKNFGLIGAAFGFGFILGPTLSGKLSEAWIIDFTAKYLPSWIASANTLPLWIATILCGLNLILLPIIFPETIKTKVSNKLNLSIAITNTINAFKLKSLRVAFVTIFLFTFGFTFFTQFLGYYIQSNFAAEIRQEAITKIEIPAQIQQITDLVVKDQEIQKYTNAVIGRYIAPLAQQKASDIFTYIGLCVVISQLLLIRLVNGKFKPYRIYQIGLLLNSISAAILLIPRTIAGLYFTLPFFALSNGLIQPNSSSIVSNSADEKSQGEILGANQSITALAQAIPPMIAGYLAGISASLTVILSSGIVFVAFILFTFFYKPTKEVFHEE